MAGTDDGRGGRETERSAAVTVAAAAGLAVFGARVPTASVLTFTATRLPVDHFHLAFGREITRGPRVIIRFIRNFRQSGVIVATILSWRLIARA